MTTQTTQLIDLLRAHPGGITPLEALRAIGSLRLAARVYDARALIADDEEIVTERISRNGKTFALYRLRKRAPGPQMRLGL